MSQTDSLKKLYTKLQEASANRERLYSAKGMLNWAMFASNPHEHRKKVVKVTQKAFAFGTLRITEPCLLRLTENVEFNPNSPLTWLDQQGEIYEGAWDSLAFSKAAAIDPNRNICFGVRNL